jgi:hypothetical protein
MKVRDEEVSYVCYDDFDIDDIPLDRYKDLLDSTCKELNELLIRLLYCGGYSIP